MGMPRFFKLPKNKGFNYKPLYYDPVKEEREQRKREIEKELGISNMGDYVPTIKHGSLRSQSRKNRVRAKGISNMRLIVILILLLLGAYLFLYK